MSRRAAPALAVLLTAACGQYDAAPPAIGSPQPEVLFVVRNEVFSIRLDGTDRHSLGKVGDDRHRTGYPRLLPDGRAAVLADDTGAIFPYLSTPEGWKRFGQMNVTLNDALTGAAAGGRALLVFTTSPQSEAWPMSTRLYRLDADDPQLEAVGFQGAGPITEPGSISDPAPYDDGRVLAVRAIRYDVGTPGRSSVEILRIDRPYDHDQTRTSEKLVTLDDGYLARSPARLPDGRVVFIRVDPANVSDTALGEMFVVGLNNDVRSTGITGVLALEVVGNEVVYEIGGATNVSDLVMTDLDHAPVNLTNTPFISEHLGWSD